MAAAPLPYLAVAPLLQNPASLLALHQLESMLRTSTTTSYPRRQPPDLRCGTDLAPVTSGVACCVAISLTQTCEQVDSLYFLHYAVLTGRIRHYVADLLEEWTRRNDDDGARRLYTLSVFKEEYAAYEDAGAHVSAFLRYRTARATTPFEALLQFKAKDVRLATVFAQHGLSTGHELFDALRLSEWIPPTWAARWPSLKLEATIRRVCEFLAQDCARAQKDEGVVAYNKIKHGAIVVPSAQPYLPQLPDYPGILFPTSAHKPEAADTPLTVYAVNLNDASIEHRLRSIFFIQVSLRLIAAMYVSWRYPALLTSCGPSSLGEWLSDPVFADVLKFLSEVSAETA
jgi:hypothetical protein